MSHVPELGPRIQPEAECKLAKHQEAKDVPEVVSCVFAAVCTHLGCVVPWNSVSASMSFLAASWHTASLAVR